MQKKNRVAVLDFGSSKISAVVGERGVNNTFLIKAKKDFEYDGYQEKEFFNVDGVKLAIKNAIEYFTSVLGSDFKVYVGVPGEFTETVVKDCQISFPKKKKIEEKDVDVLYDSAFVISSKKYTLINRSAVLYELDDYRRLMNPVNAISSILKGKLSFVLCDNYFIDICKAVFASFKINEYDFVSTPLAMAMYLIDASTRDRVAMIVDVGFIGTTFTLIQGDGVLYQKSFAYGGGYITAMISEELDISFEDAEKLKRMVSITRSYEKDYDLISLDDDKYYSAKKVSEIMRNSIDSLCEELTNCLENSGYVIPEYVPLFLTGGGVNYIRGAKQHVSSRLGVSCEYLAPSVPLMDKPTDSSVLSLLNLTFEQNAN